VWLASGRALIGLLASCHMTTGRGWVWYMGRCKSTLLPGVKPDRCDMIVPTALHVGCISLQPVFGLIGWLFSCLIAFVRYFAILDYGLVSNWFLSRLNWRFGIIGESGRQGALVLGQSWWSSNCIPTCHARVWYVWCVLELTSQQNSCKHTFFSNSRTIYPDLQTAWSTPKTSGVPAPFWRGHLKHIKLNFFHIYMPSLLHNRAVALDKTACPCPDRENNQPELESFALVINRNICEGSLLYLIPRVMVMCLLFA
jgi:hypothetical protein